MTREVYLQRLRRALAGKVSGEELERTVRYYAACLDEAGPEGEEALMAEWGAPEELAERLRAAAGQEPYDEGLIAQLIRCYAAMGEVKNAMTAYNRLKDTLARDLGAEPGEEVTRIYKECLLRRLGSGRSPV